MFESRIKFLLKHHPLYFLYRELEDIERLDDPERCKPPLPDIAAPAGDDARTRSFLDLVDIAAAVLLLAGFIALMAVSDGAPPNSSAATVAHLRPNER